MDASPNRTRGAWQELRSRIGQRHQVGLPARWRAHDQPPPTRRRGLRKAAAEPTPGDAIVHDLSVSGARLLVPATDLITPRALIDLELAGAWGRCQVAWVSDTEEAGALWCGVLFLQPGPAFMEAITRAMDVSGVPTRRPPSVWH
ncbi:MAG TPA: hypothetical protein VHK88_03975 [Aquihabitans sp.]|jgi:hypothetical protein|nr:hypothetical protein [Aquihabitans sp.]